MKYMQHSLSSIISSVCSLASFSGCVLDLVLWESALSFFFHFAPTAVFAFSVFLSAVLQDIFSSLWAFLSSAFLICSSAFSVTFFFLSLRVFFSYLLLLLLHLFCSFFFFSFSSRLYRAAALVNKHACGKPVCGPEGVDVAGETKCFEMGLLPVQLCGLWWHLLEKNALAWSLVATEVRGVTYEECWASDVPWDGTAVGEMALWDWVRTDSRWFSWSHEGQKIMIFFKVSLKLLNFLSCKCFWDWRIWNSIEPSQSPQICCWVMQ